MFYVRSPRVPCPPSLWSGLPRARAACATAAPSPLRPPGPPPRPASHALLSTRQRASAFNQPLSFDTSSVTDMDRMFYVRSEPALPPSIQSGPPRARAACAAAAPRPGASRPTPLALHHMPSFRLGRKQTPCPTPTSWRSVAHGRVTWPLPLLAMTRAGCREAAPEYRLHVCARDWAESMATALDHSPLFACGGHLFSCAHDEPRTRRGARILSTRGGGHCGCRHARAALEQVGGREGRRGRGERVRGGVGALTRRMTPREANRRYTRRTAFYIRLHFYTTCFSKA